MAIVLLTLPLNAEATPKENPEEVMSGNPNKNKIIAYEMMLYLCDILPPPFLSKPINKTTFTPHFIGFVDVLSFYFFTTEIIFGNPVDLQVVGDFGFAVDLRRLDLGGGQVDGIAQDGLVKVRPL